MFRDKKRFPEFFLRNRFIQAWVTARYRNPVSFAAACWQSKQRSSKNTSAMFAEPLATARLLLALFNHSRRPSGGYRSGDIQFLPFSQYFRNDAAGGATVSFQILGYQNDNVHGTANTNEAHVNLLGGFPPVDIPGNNYGYINIAVRLSRPAAWLPNRIILSGFTAPIILFTTSSIVFSPAASICRLNSILFCVLCHSPISGNFRRILTSSTICLLY